MRGRRSIISAAEPCRRRPAGGRVAAVITAGLALSALPAAVPPGSAQDLDDQKAQVERRIDQTEEHLQHSSERLVAAARRLDAAETELAAARTTLAETRGELAAAQALDESMQLELAAAEEELARARTALAGGRAGLAKSEEAMRTIAAQQQATGGTDLMALSTVLNSQDPAQLTGQLTSRSSVLDKEAGTLAELEAAHVLLTVQEKAFQEAQQEVARQRAAAAANLALKAQLELRAERAKGRIEDLVGVRAEARREAAAAKAEDLAQLHEFESERDQIAELLRKRAAEARARAEAAARARAQAAARARAAAARAAEARSGDSGQGSPPAPAPRPVPQPAPPSSGLMYPVNGYITSPYGMRLHPVYHRWTLHDGTDFGAGCGTPIRAAASGTVVGRYYDGAYGNRVIIDHGWVSGGGLGTTYNHLSSFSTYVGDRVQRGEVIGYVGSTGYSTGCHLHFMVFRNGATVDPMNWL